MVPQGGITADLFDHLPALPDPLDDPEADLPDPLAGLSNPQIRGCCPNTGTDIHNNYL